MTAPARILCAHADDGQPMHWLEPGEKCARVTCPVAWCVQTTEHGVHQSAVVNLPRGVARWSVSVGQVDDTPPHITVIYLGVQPSADAHWHLSPAEAAQYALFAARTGEAQLAAALTTMSERAELVKM